MKYHVTYLKKRPCGVRLLTSSESPCSFSTRITSDENGVLSHYIVWRIPKSQFYSLDTAQNCLCTLAGDELFSTLHPVFHKRNKGKKKTKNNQNISEALFIHFQINWWYV